MVFRGYLQAPPNNSLQKAPLMEARTFGPDQNVVQSSAQFRMYVAEQASAMKDLSSRPAFAECRAVQRHKIFENLTVNKERFERSNLDEKALDLTLVQAIKNQFNLLPVAAAAPAAPAGPTVLAMKARTEAIVTAKNCGEAFPAPGFAS